MASQQGRQRRRVLFSGHVQGVGFRFRTCEIAESHSVTGFVRNLSDGRVELVAEGRIDDVDRFVQAVEVRLSEHIAEVENHSSPGTGEFTGFGIRS
jgi:acylphosphatase